MKIGKIYTSESVGAGHPDKICDQIADTVLDRCLAQDPNSKVACEVLAANRLIVIGGEIKTKGYVDVIKCAWDVLFPLGYNESDFTIISNVNSQSSEINQAVEKVDGDIGAGDQGIVFGYACNETNSFMPLSYCMARDLVLLAESIRRKENVTFIKSDMKSQVSIDFTDENNPKLLSMLMSVQHSENYDEKEFKKLISEEIMDSVASKYGFENTDFKKIINPSNSFVVGGPIGDTGLTGRKIIVDSYGGCAKHGGGAFSGKDASKVDRSGAYLARYIAKNIVAAKLAKQCEIQLSYSIGKLEPETLFVNTFNTGIVDDDQIANIIPTIFPLKVSDVIKYFGMRRPIYREFSTYGHFGRNSVNALWENLDKVEDLKKAFNVRNYE